MMNISSILQKCHQQGVLLSLNEQEGLHFKLKTGKIRKSLKDRLIANKAQIIQQFRSSSLSIGSPALDDKKEDASIATDKKDISRIEPKRIEASFLRPMQSSLNDLSSEEIVRYRHALEETYLNPIHDEWHGDGMPQKFREREHTFAEMETAIIRFMKRVQKDKDTTAAVIALTKAQEALPEYQDYLEKQKLLAQNPNNLKLKETASLSWNAYVQVCAALPEYKALLAAKERQYLFAPFRIKDEENAIIQSYPAPLRHLLKKLVAISHGQDQSFDAKQMESFRNNMKWLFVSFNKEDEWCPARLKTLWEDGWKEEEIIRFMMSKPVKYILCHNRERIQSLDLNKNVSVFEKKRHSTSDPKPITETP